MDSELKRELVASAVPAVVVPLIRAGVNHRYTMKQLDRREKLEMRKAEKQAEATQAMARLGGAEPRRAPRRDDPVSLDSPGDVYDELQSLRTETDCGFCHSVVDSLMEAPPDEARRGYDELRSYVREVERIEDRGVSEQEARGIVDELVSRWEVVPRHAAGVA